MLSVQRIRQQWPPLTGPVPHIRDPSGGPLNPDGGSPNYQQCIVDLVDLNPFGEAPEPRPSHPENYSATLEDYANFGENAFIHSKRQLQQSRRQAHAPHDQQCFTDAYVQLHSFQQFHTSKDTSDADYNNWLDNIIKQMLPRLGDLLARQVCCDERVDYCPLKGRAQCVRSKVATADVPAVAESTAVGWWINQEIEPLAREAVEKLEKMEKLVTAFTRNHGDNAESRALQGDLRWIAKRRNSVQAILTGPEECCQEAGDAERAAREDELNKQLVQIMASKAQPEPALSLPAGFVEESCLEQFSTILEDVGIREGSRKEVGG